MRVLFAHKFGPGHYGHLAAALAAERGNEIVFLHAEGEVDIPGVRTVRIAPQREARATTHHYVQGFENAVLLGQAAYRAAARLARDGFRPDIICAHAGFGPGLYLKDAFPGVPLLGHFEWYYHARGADADFLDPRDVNEDDALRIRTRNAGLLLELANCDGGICPTAFQHSQFPREFRHKLTVLHEGVDTDYFRPAAADNVEHTRLGLPEDAEIVTYATRGLEPYRGFPQFAAALARLQAARPRLHAVVLGTDRAFYGKPAPDGQSHKDLALAAAPGLDRSRVHFLGHLPLDEYRAVLRASHAHVYLTVPFVLSWSLLEAMATGCAVIGSDTEPVREVLRHGESGLLADLRDPEAIAAAVARVLDDRALAVRFGSAARRHVEAGYALGPLLARHVALIRGLARGERRPRLRFKSIDRGEGWRAAS